MKEEMEKAIEDLARALDRLCDVTENSEYLRMALAINVIGMQDAKSAREKHFILGYIAAMIQAINRKACEAMEVLHRVRGMVIKEEEGA